VLANAFVRRLFSANNRPGGRPLVVLVQYEAYAFTRQSPC